MKHAFGGLWTRKKLAVLEQYLQAYTTALKNMPFTLHYVDAFAGTGSQDPRLKDSQDELIPHEDLEGSVRTALGVEPGFHQYHFNDLNQDHVKQLEEIKREYPDKSSFLTQKDANSFVPEFCRKLTKKDRAVLFLDPYSTQLDWETLKYVAATGKIDLWLLFPISVIIRMTPTEGARIRPEWRETLSRLLGADDWQKALYKPKKQPLIDDMFGEGDDQGETERINVEELQAWVTNRLEELFSYVASPVPLENNKATLFLFYFAVSNPSEKARGLANRVVKAILKKQF